MLKFGRPEWLVACLIACLYALSWAKYYYLTRSWAPKIRGPRAVALDAPLPLF